MNRRLLALLIFTLGFISAVRAQEPPAVAQYRGGAGRDGYYPAHGVPFYNGLKWQLTLDSPALAPLIAGDSLFVPTVSGELLALDAETGTERWRFALSDSMASTPVVADGVAYVGGGDGVIYALDAMTGEQQWSFHAGSPVWSSPLIHIENTLYTGDETGNIYAIDLDTHQPAWTTNIGESVLWSGAGDDAQVYFATWTQLVALNRQTGKVVWHLVTPDKWMAPAVADGVVYVGTGENEFLALNADSGETRWQFSGPTVPIIEWSAPVIAVEEGKVYVGHSSSTLFALNTLTGLPEWQLPVTSWASSDALFDGGLLYFGVSAHGPESLDDTTSMFYVVRSTTGEVHWTYETDGLIMAAPALADDTVYVVTTTGQLYAFE